jgi:hypothetical protein
MPWNEVEVEDQRVQFVICAHANRSECPIFAHKPVDHLSFARSFLKRGSSRKMS